MEKEQKNLEKAFIGFKKQQKKIILMQCFSLANHYYNGLHVMGMEKKQKRILKKRFIGVKKAAEKDHIIAILATFYRNGVGTEKNFEKAFHWFQKAAEKDHIDAIYSLATFYRNGVGTEKNLAKSLSLVSKSSRKRSY
ncbi:unnamed protein product [Rhizophagus irregularis]|nr:unnamed protein product [Rhizophagus irregularis]